MPRGFNKNHPLDFPLFHGVKNGVRQQLGIIGSAKGFKGFNVEHIEDDKDGSITINLHPLDGSLDIISYYIFVRRIT